MPCLDDAASFVQRVERLVMAHFARDEAVRAQRQRIADFASACAGAAGAAGAGVVGAGAAGAAWAAGSPTLSPGCPI